MSQSLHRSKAALVGKILIVEDDLKHGEWLKESLSGAGLRCNWVRSRAEANILLEKGIYHAVITDVFLAPEHNPTDGLELIRSLKPSGIPILLMCSSNDMRFAKEAVNRGASYILERPFELKEVLSVLEEVWEEPHGLHALLERFLDIHGLTPKEKEVARLLVKGFANKEIASFEEITDRTIKAHLTNIFQKCQVTTRTEFINAVFPT